MRRLYESVDTLSIDPRTGQRCLSSDNSNGELIMKSCQLSTINYQLKAMNYQLKIVDNENQFDKEEVL